jgi:hypothetical protein
MQGRRWGRSLGEASGTALGRGRRGFKRAGSVSDRSSAAVRRQGCKRTIGDPGELSTGAGNSWVRVQGVPPFDRRVGESAGAKQHRALNVVHMRTLTGAMIVLVCILMHPREDTMRYSVDGVDNETHERISGWVIEAKDEEDARAVCLRRGITVTRVGDASPTPDRSRAAEDQPKKDRWDVVDILAKLLIPVVIAFIGFRLTTSQSHDAVRTEYVKLAIGILQAPPKDSPTASNESKKSASSPSGDTGENQAQANESPADFDRALRLWAVKVLQEGGPVPFTQELRSGFRSNSLPKTNASAQSYAIITIRDTHLITLRDAPREIKIGTIGLAVHESDGWGAVIFQIDGQEIAGQMRTSDYAPYKDESGKTKNK